MAGEELNAQWQIKRCHSKGLKDNAFPVSLNNSRKKGSSNHFDLTVINHFPWTPAAKTPTSSVTRHSSSSLWQP